MMRAQRGFTLLEVAMAGAILMMGMMLIAQLTRSVLDGSRQGAGGGVQDGVVIEQYMQSQVAYLKSFRTPATTPLADLPYADGYLHIRPITETPLNTAGGYTLFQYDVQVELSSTSELLGQTRFWRLVKDDNTSRAGL